MAHGETFVEGLTKILVDRKFVSEQMAQDLKKAFKDSAKPYFDEFLLDEGLIEKDDLLEALAQYFQVPSFDVSGYFFKYQLLHMFPEDFLVRQVVIPLEVDEDEMVIVANDPSLPGLESLIRNYVSYDIVFQVGLRRDIIDQVRDYYDKSLTDLPVDETAVEKRDYLLASDEAVEDIIDQQDKIQEQRDEDESE